MHLMFMLYLMLILYIYISQYSRHTSKRVSNVIDTDLLSRHPSHSDIPRLVFFYYTIIAWHLFKRSFLLSSLHFMNLNALLECRLGITVFFMNYLDAIVCSILIIPFVTLFTCGSLFWFLLL